MIAYHIDRFMSLKTGMLIELESTCTPDSINYAAEHLFGGRMSRHGMHHMANPDGIDISMSSSIEFEFELIRKAFFPDMLSRFQAFFALESLQDILSWGNILPAGQPFAIYEVSIPDTNKHHKLDSAFLRGGPNLSTMAYQPSSDFENACRYWSQAKSDNPQYELLLEPPITIGRRVYPRDVEMPM